jgi:MFS family permease
VPTVLFDSAPAQVPRPDLVGATVGLMMQGNNLGLVVGPAIAGTLAASAGWSVAGLFVLAAAVAAGRSGTAFLSPALPDTARLRWSGFHMSGTRSSPFLRASSRTWLIPAGCDLL